MSTAAVASLSFNMAGTMQGQSFTPNILGPDGNGSLANATSIQLVSIEIGYPSSDLTSRSPKVCVCSSPVADDDPFTDASVLKESPISAEDGSSFGTGSYTRKYSFSNVSLQSNDTYYIYFNDGYSVRYSNEAPYSGGSGIDSSGDAVAASCLQFRVNLEVS